MENKHPTELAGWQLMGRSSGIVWTSVALVPGEAERHLEPRPMENDHFAAWPSKVMKILRGGLFCWHARVPPVRAIIAVNELLQPLCHTSCGHPAMPQ